MRGVKTYFAHLIAIIFFKKEYIQGRWFGESKIGYVWCLKALWTRNILRINISMPFPVHHSVRISKAENIIFNPDDLNNFQSPGCYYQNQRAFIRIGKGALISQNVGIITQNHSSSDLSQHDEAMDVNIGDDCWIGMNSVILPGVTLANGIIVGAGSVVAKSILEENIIVAGCPARKIGLRKLINHEQSRPN